MIFLEQYKKVNILSKWVMFYKKNQKKIDSIYKKIKTIENTGLITTIEITNPFTTLSAIKEKNPLHINEKNLEEIENLIISKENLNTLSKKNLSFKEFLQKYKNIDIVPTYTPLTKEFFPAQILLFEYLTETRNLETEFTEDYEAPYLNREFLYKSSLLYEKNLKPEAVPVFISQVVKTSYPPIPLSIVEIFMEVTPGNITALRDFLILSYIDKNQTPSKLKNAIKKSMITAIKNIIEILKDEEKIEITEKELLKNEELLNLGTVYYYENILIEDGMLMENREFEAYIFLPSNIITISRLLPYNISKTVVHEKMVENLYIITNNKTEQDILENYIYHLIFEEEQFYKTLLSLNHILGINTDEYYSTIYTNPAFVKTDKESKTKIKRLYAEIEKHKNIVKDATQILENAKPYSIHKYILKTATELYRLHSK